MAKTYVISDIIATSTYLSFIIEFHCKLSLLLEKFWLGIHEFSNLESF
jgi:hypothetical protein